MQDYYLLSFICRPYIIVKKGCPRVTSQHIEQLCQGIMSVVTDTGKGCFVVYNVVGQVL